jgi:hypothetical protein
MATPEDISEEMDAPLPTASSDPGKVNLKKSFARVQESLAALADNLGVTRSFTCPFVDGQPTAEHVKSVGQIAATVGGLTGNLLTSGHRSGGRGFGSGDGQTIGHPVQKLKETIIPKNDESAKAAISAAQRYLSQVGSLLGEKDQSVQVAQSQLDLVKPTNAAGMTAFDFIVLVQQVLFTPTQAISRAHSGTKPGGHAPQFRAPHNPVQTATPQPAAPVAQPEQPSGPAAVPPAGVA